MTIAPLECGPCDRPLLPHRTYPQTEGASSKLLLLCDGCGRGVEVIVREGRLAMRPLTYSTPGDAA